MKRYLSAIFICLSILAVFISFQLDVRWNGILGWGLACILLLCAIYFTKHIPNDTNEEKERQKITGA